MRGPTPRPPSRGGGGGGQRPQKKKLCVAKGDPQFRAPLMHFIRFPQEKISLGGGGAGGGAQAAILPPPPPLRSNGKPWRAHTFARDIFIVSGAEEQNRTGPRTRGNSTTDSAIQRVPPELNPQPFNMGPSGPPH